jgi:hypothetical protein
MRFLISIALAGAMVLVSSTAAVAGAPTREPASPLDATFDAGEVCVFSVHIESIGEDVGTITTFPDGHLLLTGRFFVRITNLETDESIVVNASGPFVQSFPEDGTTVFDVHGPFIWILFSGDVGGPGLIYTTGHVSAVASPEFFLTSFDVLGTQRNLCDDLAAS